MGDDDQQFCLRWNNHQTTLIQNFDTLLESGTLVDCTLAAEGKYLKAHKVVLSACSPYFEGLLSEHYDKHPVFILKDVKFKELKAMMDYMYRGEVNISQDQLAALLKAAESLQIKGLSESKTGSGGNTSGSSKAETRSQKTAPQPTAPSLDIPHSSSGLTIEKNSKVPRQSLAQTSVGDLPEDSASPSLSKGISSREGSVSPNGRKRKRYRRRSLNDDNPIDNHETSNSSDMSHQPMNVPAPGVAPIADEKSMSESADSLGRSALMQQLTKPADEMLQMPVEKPEPNDTLIEPKSEYLEDPEESVEDLTLDDDFNDTNDLEPDNNRAGPSHDSSHPGHASWHVTGDRSNAGGVVGSVAGAPGSNDEVFMAAQEAANAHRDSQEIILSPLLSFQGEGTSPKRELLTRDGRFACTNPNCDKTFKNRTDCNYHIKNRCNKPPRYKCCYCDYKSHLSGNIKVHLKTHHKEIEFQLENAEVNDDSDQSSEESEETEDSLPSELSKKPLEVSAVSEPAAEVLPKIANTQFACSLTNCDKLFETQELRDDHSENECVHRNKNKEFACPNIDCDKMFTRESHLAVHITHYCSKPNRYKCCYCDHTAISSAEIESHTVQNHSGAKVRVLDLSGLQDTKYPYNCPNKNCKKGYSSRYNLNRHLKYECGKPPGFKCFYCDYKHAFQYSVERHCRGKHSDEKIKFVALLY
ncbi:protein tramtrack, beta isoform-like isoform X3 [Microplitis mediator]|uniref:protein tramtrack, beta isoform-like isoform X3 n=1 Tax=Microplitis mediator TaxID=375433 RepID=UPI002554D8B0|nr:protein tramtrack, beta isoform-like isoform X3 [Microplitis mediator]